MLAFTRDNPITLDLVIHAVRLAGDRPDGPGEDLDPVCPGGRAACGIGEGSAPPDVFGKEGLTECICRLIGLVFAFMAGVETACQAHRVHEGFCARTNLLVQPNKGRRGPRDSRALIAPALPGSAVLIGPNDIDGVAVGPERTEGAGDGHV